MTTITSTEPMAMITHAPIAQRSSPSTEMSSSRSSQWMPTPLPTSLHLLLWSSVALRSEENHSRGTEISRPSDNWTCNLSASNLIPVAKTLTALIAEVFMPLLHQKMSVRIIAHGSDQSNRIQPELRVVLCSLDVNMRWLITFIAEEEEPVAAIS
jgi:hypothetical protein